MMMELSNHFSYYRKKAVRIINKSLYLDHTPPIFKSLEILTVYQIFKLNCLVFAFKCINFFMFPYYREKISQNLNVHNYNTRHKENYKSVEILKLRIIQRSFLYNGINLWNSIENWKNDCYSISLFKKKVKSYLIDNL